MKEPAARLRTAASKRTRLRLTRAKGLAARLRAARERAGLRLCDLDTKAGLTDGHTRSIEERLRVDPSAQTVLALAIALEVSTDWLLKGREHSAATDLDD